MKEYYCERCCWYFESEMKHSFCAKCQQFMANTDTLIAGLSVLEIKDVLTQRTLEMKTKIESEKENRRYPIAQIYFIHGVKTNLTKIGYSGSAFSRLKYFQTGSPDILELWGYINAPESFERTIHKIMNQYRLHNEWFETPDWLKNWIEENGDQNSKIGYYCNFEWDKV